MYKVKEIPDNYFYDLQALYYKLQELLSFKPSKFLVTKRLIEELQLTSNLTLGLFRGDKLVGFISGYSKQERLFHVSSLYILVDYRYGTKLLLETMENLVIAKGYKGWTANSILKEGKNIITKFGAKEL